jgi:anti-sigma factor RsiW
MKHAHEEDGRLMAYVDGELLAEDARGVETHLSGCPDCALETTRLRAQRGRVQAALSRVDVDVSAASGRVRERLRLARDAAPSGPSTEHLRPAGKPADSRDVPGHPGGATPAARRMAPPARRWLLRTRALQAALFVLFMAGGAAALVPGSPLRRWLGGAREESAAAPALMRAPEPEGAVPAASSEPVRLSALPVEGRLRVSLELPVGTELSVAIAEGERATVFAEPDPATRFTSAPGVLQAAVAGGSVRVELPRGAADVSLEVNGQLYLRAQAGELRFTQPATDSSDVEYSFRIRQR